MAVVYVVRHGATSMNNQTDLSQDRIRGWSDVPLAPQGRDEAKKAAEELRQAGIQVIVTSSLSRAVETAQIIKAELDKVDILAPVSADTMYRHSIGQSRSSGIELQVNPNLRPWNLGDLTGTNTKEALPQIAFFVQQQPDQPVPNGESFNQFRQRANKGLAEAIQVAGGKPLCIITHHRDERLWKAEQATGWSNQPDLNVFLQKGDPPGGVFEMNVNPAVLAPMGGGPTTPPGAPAELPASQAAAGAPPPGLPAAQGQQQPGQSGAQPGQPPQPDPQMQQMMAALAKLQQIKKAIDLLRRDTPRGYRIDIEVDTMIAGDVEQEREDATSFLEAILKFMEGAGAIVQQQPDFAPLAAKMLQFGVRKFRTGRELESAIDEYADKISKAPPKPPQQDPQHQKAMVDMQTAKIKAQAEIGKVQQQAKSQKENDDRESQLAQQKAQLEQQKMQMEIQIKQLELQLKEREMQMKLAMQQQEGQLKTAQLHQQHQFETARMQREDQRSQIEHQRNMEFSEHTHKQRMANGASQDGNGVQAGAPAGQ